MPERHSRVLPQFTNIFKGLLGVYTLWGTFEILNKRLLKKLLHQYCRDPLALPPNVHNKGEKMVELVINLAYRFEALPPYFLKFHGTAELENAPDAMDYATYATAGT